LPVRNRDGANRATSAVAQNIELLPAKAALSDR
jgi:hypothetical protein